MQDNSIDTDYLIIGSGAAGLAFADTLVHESNFHMVIVDKNDQPGGHWNQAYPFVKLHQPSLFYGVNSRPLGEGKIDKIGLNAGLYELATGSEIMSYYKRVMNDILLPSGRVQYFPMCEYIGDGMVKSLVTGRVFKVNFRKKLVDAIYSSIQVPSTHKRPFLVEKDVHCIPPNQLPTIARAYGNFVVIGAGRTSIDTCLWLLKKGVKPHEINWIRPRDPWLMNRALLQFGRAHFESTVTNYSRMYDSILSAQTVSELYEKLSAEKQFFKIDEAVQPKTFRGSVVSSAELELIRSIQRVTRKGHVQNISAHAIFMDEGVLEVDADTLFIDCTRSHKKYDRDRPIFEEEKITIQIAAILQLPFSASLAAYLEAHYEDTDIKNKYCTVMPYIHKEIDLLRVLFLNAKNADQWAKDKNLSRWIAKSRLSFFSVLINDIRFYELKKWYDLYLMHNKGQKCVAQMLKIIRANKTGNKAR